MKTKKKNSNANLKVFLIINVIVLVLSVFIHVYNIKSIESQLRTKERKNREIKALLSEMDDLIIEKQKLLEYERIKRIAKEKLGLIPNLQVNEKITVDRRELNYLKKIIDNKYE